MTIFIDEEIYYDVSSFTVLYETMESFIIVMAVGRNTIRHTTCNITSMIVRKE